MKKTLLGLAILLAGWTVLAQQHVAPFFWTVGTADPSTCTAGELLLRTDTPAIKGCTSANTWQSLGGGSATTAPANYGYFLTWNGGAPTNDSFTFSANVLRCKQMQIDEGFSYSKHAVNIVVSAGASTLYAGLYSSDGSSKLSSGSVASTGTGATTITMSTYAITPGTYQFCIADDSATVVLAGHGIGTNGGQVLDVGTKAYMGTAANGISGAALPSTTGAITPSNGTDLISKGTN